MKIKINVKKPYDVIIKSNILTSLASYLPEGLGNTAAIITDDNVEPLYGQVVRKSLEDGGFRVITYVFKHGEANKSTDTLISILNYLADNKVTRSDFIAALGGGITGDVAGFAAGVYLRGIRYIQIPTTFLSAVDSSVGGKTGVNLTAGKNLTGLFYQPDAVICDPETFRTLDDDIFIDGVSEAVKHGFILDEDFFRALSGKTRAEYMDDIENIIARNVEIKGEIVASDEFECGRRQLLNFGHTAGHAIEKVTNHAVSHGQAVAAGMIIMTRAAYRMGYCDTDYSGDIRAAFSGFRNRIDTAYNPDDLYSAALSDKKRAGDKINIIIPEQSGKCVIKTIKAEELLDVFKAGVGT